MANTTGYTKTLVLKTSDGDVTFTGGRAYAIQRQLEDNGGLIHFTNPANEAETDFYKIDGVSCQACLVATVTAGTKEVEEINTEDELACPEGDADDGGADDGGADDGGADDGGADDGGADDGGADDGGADDGGADDGNGEG